MNQHEAPQVHKHWCNKHPYENWNRRQCKSHTLEMFIGLLTIVTRHSHRVGCLKRKPAIVPTPHTMAVSIWPSSDANKPNQERRSNVKFKSCHSEPCLFSSIVASNNTTTMQLHHRIKQTHCWIKLAPNHHTNKIIRCQYQKIPHNVPLAQEAKIRTRY